MKMDNKGFSLIELMIVVAIIGILSAMAIPNFQKFQRKARQAEGKNHLTGIYTAQKAFQAEWTVYFGSLTETGYQAEGKIRYIAGFTGVGTPNAGALISTYGYPKLNAAAVNSTHFNTRAQCSGTPNCRDVSAGVALTGFGGNVVAAFRAGANAEIGGATDDRWTIDQNKEMVNTLDGVQ